MSYCYSLSRNRRLHVWNRIYLVHAMNDDSLTTVQITGPVHVLQVQDKPPTILEKSPLYLCESRLSIHALGVCASDVGSGICMPRHEKTRTIT
jgi:hypothetical protein